MNSMEMINRLPPPSAGYVRSGTPSTHVTDPAPPHVRERLDEILPLLDFVPQAGPPVLFVLGPWLFVVLMLIGPFVLVATLVFATVTFVGIAAAICAPPYLLVHHLRKTWRRRRAWRSAVRQLRGSDRLSLLSESSTPRPVAGRAPQPLAATDLHHHTQPSVTSNGM